MTIWDHVCGLGYGIQARIVAVWHLLRGHRVRWRAEMSVWEGNTGDIICEDCNFVIWSRFHPWLLYLMQRVCGRLGHPGVYPGDAERIERYCKRCSAVWPP